MSAGLFTTVTIDPDDAVRGLEAMERRAHALGSAFAELKKPLRLDQRDHRKKRQGPESVWPPQSASTRARRLSSPKHRPRILLGRLPGSVKYTATANSVSGVSRVAWSAIHQDGGTAGKGARIPARPFLWISDAMVAVAETTLGTALVRAYGGK